MAASATEPEDHRTAGTERRPHRRRLLDHLHIQVPVPTNSGWLGCPSGPASAPCGTQHTSAPATHQDRPASPSLLRSPTAWIRSKGQSLGLSKHSPRARRSGNFHYDARSYAQNFDEGGGEEDALKHRHFSPSLLTSSPHPVSPPSDQGISGGSSNGEERTGETLCIME